MNEAVAAAVTFGEVFEAYFEDRAQNLTNAKHVATWRSSLDTYGSPIMNRPVAEIEPDETLGALPTI